MKFTIRIPASVNLKDTTVRLDELRDRIKAALEAGWDDHTVTAFGVMTESSNSYTGGVRIEQGWKRGVGVAIESGKPTTGENERTVRITVNAFCGAEQALYGIPGLVCAVAAITLGLAGVIPLVVPGNMIAAILYGLVGAGLGYAIGRPLRPLLIGDIVKQNHAFADEVAARLQEVARQEG